MVLSNKRLKQKLRIERAESLAASVDGPGTEPINPGQTPSVPQTANLKQLLAAATQKPRLSKRDKRRLSLASRGPAAVAASPVGNVPAEPNSAAVNGEESMKEDKKEKKKNKKKKKRERDGDTEAPWAEMGSLSLTKQSKAKKSVKTWKELKIRKKAKIKEQNEGFGSVGGTEAAPKISYSQENGNACTKVYVGGIPYYSTEDDIRSFFDSCGTISEMECKYFPETGKFRGIVIISFKTEAAAKRALALDGADMGGLYLKVQPYKATRSSRSSDFAPVMVEGYNRIYVGNLSWDITEDDLKKFFSDCRISSIRFGVDKETKIFQGYAHVDFSDNLSLTAALKLDQQTVCGRPVKIRCAVPKKTAYAQSKSAQPIVKTVDAQSKAAEKTAEKVEDDGMIPTGPKRKRRTCYECGIAGHLSSACPKKLGAEAS